MFVWELQNKVHGTVWTELDDTKLYKELDLSTIDKAFSAFQKQVPVGYWPETPLDFSHLIRYLLPYTNFTSNMIQFSER